MNDPSSCIFSRQAFTRALYKVVRATCGTAHKDRARVDVHLLGRRAYDKKHRRAQLRTGGAQGKGKNMDVEKTNADHCAGFVLLRLRLQSCVHLRVSVLDLAT